MKSFLAFCISILCFFSFAQAQKFGPSLAKNLASYNSFYTTSKVDWKGGYAGVTESQVNNSLNNKLRSNGIGLDSNRGPSYLELKVRVNRDSDTGLDSYLISLTIYAILEEGEEKIQLIVYNKDIYGQVNGSYYSRNKYHLESVDYIADKFIKDWRDNR